MLYICSMKHGNNIGELVRYARKVEGLSQADLARMTGLNVNTISGIEKSGKGTIGSLQAVLSALSGSLIYVRKEQIL